MFQTAMPLSHPVINAFLLLAKVNDFFAIRKERITVDSTQPVMKAK
jgi:hypothetical protein